MKQWQQAWHSVVAPNLTEGGLRALAAELRDGGSRLSSHVFIEGDANDVPVCGCAIGFAVWQDDPDQTVTAVTDRVRELMRACVTVSGAASPCLTTFTGFFDAGMTADRVTLMAVLLPEVERAVVERMLDGWVVLNDEWWTTPSPAFNGWTPWDELVTFGMERLESMALQIIHNVAN